MAFLLNALAKCTVSFVVASVAAGGLYYGVNVFSEWGGSDLALWTQDERNALLVFSLIAGFVSAYITWMVCD